MDWFISVSDSINLQCFSLPGRRFWELPKQLCLVSQTCSSKLQCSSQLQPELPGEMCCWLKLKWKVEHNTPVPNGICALSCTHQAGSVKSCSTHSAQATETPLPADLLGATELWKVQPDTPAGKTSSQWIICATQKWCDSNKLPQLAASPTHTYLLENSSYLSDKAVPPIPSGQAGKRAFLTMSVSSQELHCSPGSTRLCQNVLHKRFVWNWQFCAEEPGERKVSGSQLAVAVPRWSPCTSFVQKEQQMSFCTFCKDPVKIVLYYLTGFNFINTSKK